MPENKKNKKLHFTVQFCEEIALADQIVTMRPHGEGILLSVPIIIVVGERMVPRLPLLNQEARVAFRSVYTRFFDKSQLQELWVAALSPVYNGVGTWFSQFPDGAAYYASIVKRAEVLCNMESYTLPALNQKVEVLGNEGETWEVRYYAEDIYFPYCVTATASDSNRSWTKQFATKAEALQEVLLLTNATPICRYTDIYNRGYQTF